MGMRLVRSLLALAGTGVLSLLLSACFSGPPESPTPRPTTSEYEGPDAATLVVLGTDIGCCYVEGSLHFARLEGPTTREWKMDQPLPLGSTGPNDPMEVGSRALRIRPGEYVANFWQRPCDGNCDNLDPIVSQCRATFTARPSEHLRIDVSFPLDQQCTAVVTP
jgi:hypothetical protein